MKDSTRRWILVGLLIWISGIAVVHSAALAFSLHQHLLWLDIVLHVFGGGWVALMAIWIAYCSGYITPPPCTSIVLFSISVGTALLAGIGWEVYEVMIGMPMDADAYYTDTVSDLAADFLGACMVWWGTHTV